MKLFYGAPLFKLLLLLTGVSLLAMDDTTGDGIAYVVTPRKKSKEILNLGGPHRPSSPRSEGNSPSKSPRHEGTRSGSSSRARAGSDPRAYPSSPRIESPRSESPARKRPHLLQVPGGSSPTAVISSELNEIQLIEILMALALKDCSKAREGSQERQNNKITEALIEEYNKLKKQKNELLNELSILDQKMTNQITIVLRSLGNKYESRDFNEDDSSEE